MNSLFIPVASYNGNQLSAKVLPSDGLIVGKIYSFRFRARNVIGLSEFSNVLRVGFGAKVLAPTTVT